MTHVPMKGPSTALVAEGIPPISARLLEKIRKWEYVELSDILAETQHKAEEDQFSLNGPQNQIILVQSADQLRKKRKQITDMESWLQAFSVLAAALTVVPSTSKEESTGLLAHMYLVTQIARDLHGLQWCKYDREFREWAAATSTRVWGTLNLTIYGRCLVSTQGPVRPVVPNDHPLWLEKRGKAGKHKNKACYKYNYEISCGRSEQECRFEHICWHCGAQGQ